MTEAVTNELIYSVLQKMKVGIADLKFDISEMKGRVIATKEHLGNIILSISGLSRRVDRLDGRLGRVERRLDLTDAH